MVLLKFHPRCKAEPQGFLFLPMLRGVFTPPLLKMRNSFQKPLEHFGKLHFFFPHLKSRSNNNSKRLKCFEFVYKT